jgi:hypothetical protein
MAHPTPWQHQGPKPPAVCRQWLMLGFRGVKATSKAAAAACAAWHAACGAASDGHSAPGVVTTYACRKELTGQVRRVYVCTRTCKGMGSSIRWPPHSCVVSQPTAAEVAVADMGASPHSAPPTRATPVPACSTMHWWAALCKHWGVKHSPLLPDATSSTSSNQMGCRQAS